MKWQNLKIGVKYGIALSITISLFIIASGFVTMSLFNIKDAVSHIETATERSNTLTYMGSLFKAKEIVILEYSNFPRKSLIDEYQKIEKEFITLHDQIKPTMNTEELQFLLERIHINNKQMDDLFNNGMIAKMQGEDGEGAIELTKIYGLRAPTVQLFQKIMAEVDLERSKAMTYAYENIENSIKVLAISILTVILLGSLIVFLISRSISRNLNKVVVLTNSIAQGELAVEEIKYHGKDEVGQLSVAMNKMLFNLQNIIKEISESSLKVDDESNNLRKIAEEVQESSEQIAATMQEMSAGAEEQASSATEIASSIYNLTQLVKKANTNKEALETSSKDILNVVGKGNTEMKVSVITMNDINSILKESVEKVKQLDESSQKVSVLVQIINSIAEQTNLLALNAAIEAARAGEAGRGFAVVADEIRKLAEQVGKSVNEITEIVMGIQSESRAMTDSLARGYNKVEEGTHKIRATGEVFDRINIEIDTMVEGIKSVSNNLDEIAINSNTINMAGEQIAAISEENSAGIEQTVASVEQQNSSMENITENAHSLTSSAEILKNLVSQFKI